ncbi:MFS transporter, partial [Gordoniibacillus kamchatkensis]|uniref:MFS transporter n=1 Tax=Gordoniibacillus kamchatkensis TaxID=1590651 RepID=UPI00069865F4
MIAGLFSFGVFTILCGFAAHFWTMLLFRFLAGISGAFVSPQVWAAIPQLAPPTKILKAMGIATAGLAVAQMLGVPIGSYLAAFGWPIPFVAVGASALLIVVFVAIIMPSLPAPLAKEKAPSVLERYRALLRESKSKTAFSAYFVFQLGNFATFSFIGTWLSDQFELSVGAVMLFLGLGNTISSFFGSGLVQKIGPRPSFVIGMIILVLLFAILPFSENVTYVKLLYFLIYFIMGLLFPLMMSLLQTLSSTARGTISSLANSLMYFGATIASSVAGMLYAHMHGLFRSVCLQFFVYWVLAHILRSGVLLS